MPGKHTCGAAGFPWSCRCSQVLPGQGQLLLKCLCGSGSVCQGWGSEPAPGNAAATATATRNTNPDKQQRGDEKLPYFGAGKLAGLGGKAQVLMWGCSCEGSRGVYTHSWWDGSAATRAAAATGECEVAERGKCCWGENSAARKNQRSAALCLQEMNTQTTSRAA